MKNKTIRRTLFWILLLVSFILLAWGFWPAPNALKTLPISPSDMQIPTPESWLPDTGFGEMITGSAVYLTPQWLPYAARALQ